MKQRVPGRAWYTAGGPFHRPRVLVEDDDPALAISGFSLFQDAGFDVAVCSGPGSTSGACPLLRGEECDVLAHADVVLHGLDPGLGVAAAIRQRHPGIAVVAEQRRRPDGTLETVPGGCVPLTFPCSVKGQLEAMRRALTEGQ
jgi:CheY-like chemotaxis protein